MKQHGPWKIKSSEVKYKNPWIEVREDQVVRPDGKDGVYTTVRMKDGASVLAMDENGEVYLTKEFKYAIGKEGIEVMSGAIEKDEKPLDAAKRELKEELGLEAAEWIDLGFLNVFTSVVKSDANLYLARKLSSVANEQEGTETMNILKVPFDQAVQWVMESKITHGQSCVLILKAAKYLGKI